MLKRMKRLLSHFDRKNKNKYSSMLNKKFIFIALFWILLAITTYLLLIEVKPTPQTWPKDKLEHTVVFALLTYLGIKAYSKYGIYCCLGLAIYGGLMEVLQSLLTLTRTGSIGDWLADLVGISAALVISNLIYKKLNQKEAPLT